MKEGKNTTFLFNFEKKTAKTKTICQIKIDQAEMFKNPIKILSEIQKHFKDIYKKDEAIREEHLSVFLQDKQHHTRGAGWRE